MLLLIFSFVIIAYYWQQHHINKRKNELLQRFPGPPKLPILKHIGLVIGKSSAEIIDIMVNLAQEYGPVWRLEIPTSTTIFIQDPKIVEQILSSPKYITKSDEYKFFYNWLGEGLFVVDGKKWHQRRKIITEAFHFKILEQFTEIMEKNGNVLIEKFKRLEGRPTDVYPMFSLLTFDVLCGK
jgi:cytochrome P450 family 4